MYNIWNLPSMAGVHLANYLTQFGLRVRLINNLDSEWDWLCEAYRSCARPPLVGLSSTFYLSWKAVAGVVKRLRALDPDMDIVLGGAFANAEPIHASPAAFEPRMCKYGFRYILHAFNSDPDLGGLMLARGARRPPDQAGNLAWIDGSLRTGPFEPKGKRGNTPLLERGGG